MMLITLSMFPVIHTNYWKGNKVAIVLVAHNFDHGDQYIGIEYIELSKGQNIKIS